MVQGRRAAPRRLRVRWEGSCLVSVLAHVVCHRPLLVLYDLSGHVNELAVGCRGLVEWPDEVLAGVDVSSLKL